MLAFFRRYQKIIFLFMTVMVMISFTFFGTTQSLIPRQKIQKGDYLFSVHKRKIYSNYFDQMVHFLELEPSFCADPFKIIELNPLNDGVISQDFLGSQLLSSVLSATEFSPVFFASHAREKEYKLYVSNKENLSVPSIWESFAPQLKQAYEKYCGLQECSFAELIDAKVELALWNQRMNGEMVKSFLSYLSYQSGKEIVLPHDLSLFGYHNWSDWFGKNSIEMVAKVILYGAEAAKKKGIKVAKEEVVEDLFQKSCLCLKTLKERGNITLNEEQFFQFLLSRSGIEKENLFQIWEDVLVFRRGMDQQIASVILDAHALESFARVANQSVTVKGVSMENFQFQDEKDWMGFEIYLDVVGCAREDILALPEHQKDLNTIAKNVPEFCGKRYLFEVKKLEKEQLKAKVAVQELRRWQKEHIDLLHAYGIFHESDLDKLDRETADKVESFCYSQIIDLHPEWIEEALSKKTGERKRWFYSLGENSCCLEGIKSPAIFAKYLERKEKIPCYTQDQQHFYQIENIEESELELLSYQEAKQEGILKKLYESGRYHNLQKRVQDVLTNYLVQAGYTIPQEKGKFLAAHRFIKQLQNGESSCFEPSIQINHFYETIDRSHPAFSKIKMLQKDKKESVVLKNRGLVVVEKQDELIDSSASFTKLKQLHQVATLDLKKNFVKKIIEGIDK